MMKRPHLSNTFWHFGDKLYSAGEKVKETAHAFACHLRRQTERDPSTKVGLLQKELWYNRLASERTYQREYHLADPEAMEWHVLAQDPRRKVDDPLLIEHLKSYALSDVKIIDVGSGAITTFGYTYPGKSIEVTAVDPLADYYARLLARQGVHVPFPTIKGDGETLLDRFAPCSFDFAYARNSLDHSYDPLTIVRNMIALVKPGGYVLLKHYRNEGGSHYEGLHQWNFDCRDGKFVIWNARRTQVVTDLVNDEVEVRCSLNREPDGEVVLASMKKRSVGHSMRDGQRVPPQRQNA
jgi:SAM-dependent methyltransferase